jgi:NAD(P)H-hydrate epimerase
VVARHLELEGVEVVIRWIAEPGQLSADAAVQYRILERAGVDQAAWPDGGGAGQLGAVLEGVEWVVDGLLGTGLSREVGGPLRGVIEALNGSGKPVVALDVPSGLDADCGLPLGVAVRAAATVSFVAPKLGFGRPGAADYTGPVVVVPIGVPRRLLREFDPAV